MKNCRELNKQEKENLLNCQSLLTYKNYITKVDKIVEELVLQKNSLKLEIKNFKIKIDLIE